MAPKTYKPAKITKPTTKAKERRCKKNIAVLLSLVGFRDDNPNVTTEILLARLREIKQREAKSVKKIIIKFSGKTSCVMTRQQPTTTTEPLHHSDDDTMILQDSRNTSPNNPLSYGADSDDHSVKDMMKKDSRNACSEMIKGFEASVDKVMKKDSRNTCSVVIKGSEADQSINKDMEKDSRNLIDFIKSIGGTKVEFMMEKQLTKTDVTRSQGRLLIPRLQVKNDGFLTEDEDNKLRINKESIKVLVLDPERRPFTMNIGIWSMIKSENYVLKSGWNQVVDMNGLKENMMVQVWSFRADQQMSFAIVRV